MRKLSSVIKSEINNIDSDISLSKKAYRAAQVRAMWADCVDEIFLEHTNSIYILNETDKNTQKNIKTLIVYVDESIFAAELNAQRELIKLRLLQKHNEEIDDFKILISRGNYKKNYPFLDHTGEKEINKVAIPLDEDEKERIKEITSVIEDKKLRENLAKAMESEWVWKKGLKETEGNE